MSWEGAKRSLIGEMESEDAELIELTAAEDYRRKAEHLGRRTE